MASTLRLRLAWVLLESWTVLARLAFLTLGAACWKSGQPCTLRDRGHSNKNLLDMGRRSKHSQNAQLNLHSLNGRKIGALSFKESHLDGRQTTAQDPASYYPSRTTGVLPSSPGGTGKRVSVLDVHENVDISMGF